MTSPRFKKILALAAVSLFFSAISFASIDPDEFSSDSERLRYQSFIADLRCPKCQNQNLAGSDAPIAADLRKELRRLLKEGQSDQQIVDFMVARYGEFILYKPPFDKHTAILWLTPIVLLGAGIVVIGSILWRHRRKASGAVISTAALNTDEKAQVAALLNETAVKSENIISSTSSGKAPTGRGKHA
jgi:cytochrome c-type biogenesis protein CcmH